MTCFNPECSRPIAEFHTWLCCECLQDETTLLMAAMTRAERGEKSDVVQRDLKFELIVQNAVKGNQNWHNRWMGEMVDHAITFAEVQEEIDRRGGCGGQPPNAPVPNKPDGPTKQGETALRRPAKEE